MWRSMKAQIYIISFVLAIGYQTWADSGTDYIKIVKQDGRPLFQSKKFGIFFSVGSNSFMESAANLKMKEAFKHRSIDSIYEEQFKSYLEFGFNSLGGWSNTEFLKGRLPYSIVLFDDEKYPHASPLKDCKGNTLPSGDAQPIPNPFNDPFDQKYINDVKKYLKSKIQPVAHDTSLMLYWVGHEFGVGGSDYIDLAQFTYSKGVQEKFTAWLKKKYNSVSSIQTAWRVKGKSFEEITVTCPQNKTPAETLDRKEFMSYVLRTWFELVVDEIRKNDHNHLISTPKLSIWDHNPQLGLAEKDGHFIAMKGLFDIISVDWYTANSEFSNQSLSQILRLSSYLNIPVLVAEFGTRQKIEGWTNTPGAKTLLNTQEERGERYRSQIMQLFSNKAFIGAHWFRWQDHITQTDQMNKGIVSTNGGKIEPYSTLQNAMAHSHKEILGKIKTK